MCFSFRSLLIAAALMAWAPGCGAIVERAHGDADPDVGDDGEVEDDEDDDATIGEPDASARSSVCPSATFSGEAGDAIAVTWSQERVDLVLRDGSLVSLPLPTEQPPGGVLVSVGVATGGGRVVVTRGWTASFSPEWVAHSTTRWFDRTGAQLDELVSEEGLWAAQVTSGGTTLMVRPSGDRGYVSRHADGSLHELPDFDVWGPPLASGWLRGYDTALERAALVDPVSLERRIAPSGVSYPVMVDDGFALVEAGPTGWSLLHVTPEASTTTPLPALAGIPQDRLSTEAVARSPWLLVTDWTAGAEWRVDVTTGDVVAVDATPPAGSTLLDDTCGLAHPLLTSAGDLVTGLRSGGDGVVAVKDLSGGAWRPLGAPFAQPGTFSVQEVAGTFFATGGDGRNTYCPIGWEQPASAGALAVPSVQIVRPSTGSTRVVEGVDDWSIVPSRDGGCVTFSTHSPDWTTMTRSMLDVVDGEALELPGDWFLWID